jgi:hypothetical protein
METAGCGQGNRVRLTSAGGGDGFWLCRREVN